MEEKKIAPSILSADFGKFAQEAAMLEKSGADLIHIDMMDGHFVDNLTFGVDVVKALRQATSLFFDCHLMVENPEKYIPGLVSAGADSMTFHVEASQHPHAILQKIRAAGLRAAIALNPGTPLDAIRHLLPLCDMVLIMTVNPGFGGQVFIPEMMTKVLDLIALRKALDLNFDIEVDGGIDDETISLAERAGADIFVAGSFVFKDKPAEQIQKLKMALKEKRF